MSFDRFKSGQIGLGALPARRMHGRVRHHGNTEPLRQTFQLCRTEKLISEIQEFGCFSCYCFAAPLSAKYSEALGFFAIKILCVSQRKKLRSDRSFRSFCRLFRTQPLHSKKVRISACPLPGQGRRGPFPFFFGGLRYRFPHVKMIRQTSSGE